HPSWGTPLITLHYDDCGRLVSDSLGRSLTWDAQDRLTHVEFKGKTCAYGYDPSGNLCDRVVDGQLSRSFFSAGQTTHEQTGTTTVQHISDGASLFALNSITSTILLGQDAQGSVRIEAGSEVRSRHYTAHGAESGNSPEVPYGYTGERREPLTGWYIPAGYRPYDPLLMMFLSPDSESPFGRGGLNPYTYCGGDPVNRIDPDGHSSETWLLAGFGLVLGVLATVASFGAAAPAFAAVYSAGLAGLTASGAMAMGAATLGAVSLGTGIASTALEAVNKDSKAAGILGWVSLGTGLVGSGLQVAPKATAKLTNVLGRSAGRGTSKLGTSKLGNSSTMKTVGESTAIYFNGADKSDVVFHNKLLGTDVAAFETHGKLRTGKLMSVSGRFEDAESVANSSIRPWLEGIDYPEGKEIVLLACHGGGSGAAQKVANTLRRPVEAFDRAIYLDDPRYMQRINISFTNSTSNNFPAEKVPYIDRLLGSGRAFTDKPSMRISIPRTYYPQ
ncbi:RHS repeat-associated core domain-containing protein, partial [Pseudomonas sp. H9]|uniref:RHS repeat-associated core domain-containing protein n=1 Tax=Pseudomonas sp. H9 TaxID=483968 RepID=UPI0010576D40